MVWEPALPECRLGGGHSCAILAVQSRSTQVQMMHLAECWTLMLLHVVHLLLGFITGGASGGAGMCCLVWLHTAMATTAWVAITYRQVQ